MNDLRQKEMSWTEKFGADRGHASQYLAFALLFAAHLLFVVLQFIRLWDVEHYQFFPFALAAFVWLAWSRRLPGSFRWDHLSSVLVVADLGLLAAGAFIFSPWLVCVGALLLLLAVCRSQRDAEFQGSLGYLWLLPLITLPLPLQYDLKVIQWLQAVTTTVASQLLNFFGCLHLRTGSILEFPGKRFMVEEACSGVQSLFTLLFLATLIACLHRRRFFHTAVLVASAAGFAGVMNVLRVCTVSVAWYGYRIDLSAGWQHDAIGYVALIVAALFVLSADAFMEFAFTQVPDIRGVGARAIFRNPFVSVWNSTFHRKVRSAQQQPGELSVSASAHWAVPIAAGVICLGFVVLQVRALL